jgi:hypothetical protein
MARPQGPVDEQPELSWDDMTLTYFVTHYERSGGAQRRRGRAKTDTPAVPSADRAKAATACAQPKASRLQWIRRVDVPRCVQTGGMTAEKDRQDFYYSMLMLHLPFRAEENLLRRGDEHFVSPMAAVAARSADFNFHDIAY